LDGWLVTIVTNETLVEEDGGQVTWIPCNILFVQIFESIADGLGDTIS
jgi:hypothetical protein